METAVDHDQLLCCRRRSCRPLSTIISESWTPPGQGPAMKTHFASCNDNPIKYLAPQALNLNEQAFVSMLCLGCFRSQILKSTPSAEIAQISSTASFASILVAFKLPMRATHFQRGSPQASSIEMSIAEASVDAFFGRAQRKCIVTMHCLNPFPLFSFFSRSENSNRSLHVAAMTDEDEPKCLWNSSSRRASFHCLARLASRKISRPRSSTSLGASNAL